MIVYIVKAVNLRDLDVTIDRVFSHEDDAKKYIQAADRKWEGYFVHHMSIMLVEESFKEQEYE